MPDPTARTAALALLLASLLAGCAAEPPAAGTAASEADARPRPTVVALLDTGTNPYHDAFRAAPGGTSVARLLPLAPDAEPVPLTAEGDFAQRRSADAPFWDSVQPGKLYAFLGTRLMAISLGAPAERALVLDGAGVASHGTGTSSLVAREDPDAIVVVVQVDDVVCDAANAREECPILSPSLAQGMAWAAAQPWIDVVSVSIAFPANAPLHPDAHPEVAAYLEASRAAHAAGKIIVNGAGNTATPPLPDHYNGPPWVIAVGGAEAAQRGEAPGASKVVDVVANYTERVALGESVDGHQWLSGTSFATPIVAGTLSRAIYAIRAELGDREGIRPDGALAEGTTAEGAAARVTSGDLRDALNASAAYFGATEWDPTRPTSNETLRDLATKSLPVVAPFAQMGWGHVHAGLAEEVAARAMRHDLSPPPEKALAAQHQAQAQALREAYWGQVGGR